MPIRNRLSTSHHLPHLPRKSFSGICVAMPIYYATGSKAKGFLWALLSGVSEPVGALLGYFALGDGDNDLAFAVVFGLVAGEGAPAILCGGCELLPQGRCRRHLPPVRSVAGAGGGTGSSHRKVDNSEESFLSTQAHAGLVGCIALCQPSRPAVAWAPQTAPGARSVDGIGQRSRRSAAAPPPPCRHDGLYQRQGAGAHCPQVRPRRHRGHLWWVQEPGGLLGGAQGRPLGVAHVLKSGVPSRHSGRAAPAALIP